MPDPILRAESKLIRRAFVHAIQYHHEAPTWQDFKDITEWTWACAFHRTIQDIRTEYGINPWDEETSLRDRLTDADLQVIMDAESLMVTVFDMEEPRTTEDFARLINETLAPDIEIPTGPTFTEPPIPGWPPTLENVTTWTSWRLPYRLIASCQNGTAPLIYSTRYFHSFWKNLVTGTQANTVKRVASSSYISVVDKPLDGYADIKISSRYLTKEGVDYFMTMSIWNGTTELMRTTIPITIVLYNSFISRPGITAGPVTTIRRMVTARGATVCQLSSSVPNVSWEIVSGNPIFETHVGFTINQSGLITVGNPRLFIDDPYLTESAYPLIVKATAGNVFGLLELPVPIT